MDAKAGHFGPDQNHHPRRRPGGFSELNRAVRLLQIRMKHSRFSQVSLFPALYAVSRRICEILIIIAIPMLHRNIMYTSIEPSTAESTSPPSNHIVANDARSPVSLWVTSRQFETFSVRPSAFVCSDQAVPTWFSLDQVCFATDQQLLDS